jgi:diguanylate cyclase (GGDEF)-like protein/PAS domain S-box-containing protein
MSCTEIIVSPNLSQALMDCSETGIFVVKNGRFVYLSRLFEQISGYKSSELLETMAMDLVYADDKEYVRQIVINRLKNQISSPFEYRSIRKNGDLIWILERVVSFNLDGDKVVLGSFFDITDRKRAEKLLQESEAKYKLLTDNSLTGIYINQSGKFVFVNNRFSEIHGYSPADLIGTEAILLNHLDERDKVRQLGDQIITGNISGTIHEVRRLKKDGTNIWCQMMEQAIEYGGEKAIMGNVIEVTDRKRMEAAIEHLAYFDPLTDLPNRSLFNDRASLAIGQALRHNHKVAIMVLDLDNFKEVNDSFGHDAGDLLLRKVGKRLKSLIRATDTISRFAGDEFILLFPELKHETEANQIARRVLTSLRKPFLFGKSELYISASIGVTIFPDDGKTQYILIKRADEAMYRVKRSGRNNFCRYEEKNPVVAQIGAEVLSK